MKTELSEKTQRELLHYGAVYAVLLFAWVKVMEYFKGDQYYTAATVFIVFIAADKLAHKIFKLP